MKNTNNWLVSAWYTLWSIHLKKVARDLCDEPNSTADQTRRKIRYRDAPVLTRILSFYDYIRTHICVKLLSQMKKLVQLTWFTSLEMKRMNGSSHSVSFLPGKLQTTKISSYFHLHRISFSSGSDVETYEKSALLWLVDGFILVFSTNRN